MARSDARKQGIVDGSLSVGVPGCFRGHRIDLAPEQLMASGLVYGPGQELVDIMRGLVSAVMP
jgi:hypothetical protein